MEVVPVNVMDRARTGAKQFASGFTPGQKAVTVAAVVAALVGGYVLFNMSGKPTYAPLFTNLNAADASTITSKLSSAKIPYQLSNGGTTILVPANDVSQERITLAAAGLPSGGNVGLSLLDKEGITTSNMTQQADYLRALQGELSQTIDSIAGVAGSQVNIAMPANQDFALAQSTPSGASVLVSMQAGQTLSSDEVQAIVHLVASSVPNLNASAVTVADSTGALLAGPGVVAAAAGGGASGAYDASVQQKVASYLDSVVGAGNADVQVNSNFDYSQVSTTTNSVVLGTNGQPVSFCTNQQSTNETYTGTGTPAGGTAGTITAAAGSTGTGTYTNTSTNNTCETSQQTQTVQQAPGTLKNQSIAVLLNSTSIPKGTNLAQLQAGVAAAAGINTSRGDQLAFSTMPFNNAASTQAAAAAKAATAASKSQATSSLMKEAAMILVLAVVLFLLWRSARKARKSPTVLGPGEMEALRAARELNHTTIMPAVRRPEMSSPPALEAATINRLIDNQPEDVASLLRSWLQDDAKVKH